jgi:hypothetical protein
MKPLDKIRAEGFNAGIEAAAKVADPPLMHRKGKPGMWRLRRKKIADDIRACKVEFESA